MHSAKVLSRLDDVAEKHVELNEKFLMDFFEKFIGDPRLLHDDQRIRKLRAGMAKARMCCKQTEPHMLLQQPRKKPSYTVKQKPHHLPSRVHQLKSMKKAKVMPEQSVNEDASFGSFYYSTEMPSTPPRVLVRQPTAVNQSLKNQLNDSTPKPFKATQLSPGQASFSASTPMRHLKKNLNASFQVILPSSQDESASRKIQSDKGLTQEVAKSIVEIVENISDSSALLNSSISVTMKHAHVMPGRYDIARIKH
jgi:hypothetical protein